MGKARSRYQCPTIVMADALEYPVTMNKFKGF